MANYTYTTDSITGTVGTTAGTQTAILMLSPKSGYRLVASDFSIANTANLENIVITQQGANVRITFDLIDTILFDSEDVELDINISGDARISVIHFDGDLDFNNDPNDGYDFIVTDNDDNISDDGVLNVDTDGEPGDTKTVGTVIITTGDGQELPEDDNGPIEPDVDLPSPYSLGDGVLTDDGWVFDIIVTIPADDTTGQNDAVTTDDITGVGDTVSTGQSSTDTKDVEWIKVDTSGLDGLNGGFILITAAGDPGASGSFSLTPTVEPASSSATYDVISGTLTLDSEGKFKKIVRIPSAAGDENVGNAICTPETPDDVDDIVWGFDFNEDSDTNPVDITDLPDPIKLKNESKITISFISPDSNIPQPVDGGASIGSDWRYNVILGPKTEGSKSNGGIISIEVPPPSGGNWTLNGTSAENTANEVKIIESEEIILRTENADPNCDFCRGKAIKLSNGNLSLFLEFSEGVFQNDNSLYEIPLVTNIAYTEPAVILNFSDGANYTVDDYQIVYSGTAGGLVTGADLSVTLTANSGYTWHDTDLVANIASFVANGHSNSNIASVTVTPTVASLQGAVYTTPTSTITVTWTLTGNYANTPVVYDFTPTGGPKAVANVDFNEGDNFEGANNAATNYTINNIQEITSVEGRSYSEAYTLTANTGLIFGTPHNTTIAVTSGSVTAPTGTGSTLTGTITGTIPSYDAIVNINLTGKAGIDTDGDGILNEDDTDDDGDGVLDANDAFPLDPTEDTDTDSDGTGDNADTDDDNDGVADTEDDFPLDDTEDTDTDGDGIGDNADTDDDNDGTLDSEDDLPLDATEDTDTDGDGTGDNADTDDDNDGVADTVDAFPLDSTRSEIIFNTTQGDISSTLGDAIDVSFVLNHTIDATVAFSGDSNITFSYEGTDLTATTALPYTDGTTALRVQIPQSNNYDGSTTGILTISAVGQSDIVINVSQTEEVMTFSTTSASTIEFTGDGSIGETISVDTNFNGLEWTAVSSDSDVVSITSGDSGTGSGTVTYTAVANDPGNPASSATVTLSAEGFNDIVITINISATEVSFLIEGTNSDYTDNTPIASSETTSSISIGSNKSTLTWTVTGFLDPDNILNITTLTGDLQTDLEYTTSTNGANEGSKSASIIISYIENGYALEDRTLTVNLPEGASAPVEFPFHVYESGTINPVTSLYFDDLARPIEIDVYINSETGAGGFTASLGSTDFTITPESGDDGTSTITITPANHNTGTLDIVDTLTITSVSHPTSSITIGLTQVRYTTITVEAVDFDISAAPTSTPLAFRFTSNNPTAGWRQISLGDEFAVPETTPEGAYVLRGGTFINNPEFTFELPSPTTSGTETLTADWSAIRRLGPPAGVTNAPPHRLYDDYLNANGIVNDSITITTAPLAWSTSESVVNLTSVGTSSYGINVIINDRRVAWTAVSSDNNLVTLEQNASGVGSGELVFSVSPSAASANAYSETITLSAANVNDIVVTVNVAASPAFEFVIVPNYYNKIIGNINSTGNTLLLDVNDNATTWTATSSSGNLVITNGSSGIGDGTVTYSIISDSNIVDTEQVTITLSASGIDDVVVNVTISNPDVADMTVNRSGVVSYNGEAIDKTFEVSHTRNIGIEIPGGAISVYIDGVLSSSNTTVVNTTGLTQITEIRAVVAAQGTADLADSIVFTSTGLSSKTVNVKQFIGTPEFTGTVALNTRYLTAQVLWEEAYNDWITNPPIDKTITSYANKAAAVANGVPEQLAMEKYWYGQFGAYDQRPHPDNPSILKARYPGQDSVGTWRPSLDMHPWWDETRHTVPYLDIEHEFPDSFTVDSTSQNLQLWNGSTDFNNRLIVNFTYNFSYDYNSQTWSIPSDEDLWVHLGTRDDISLSPRSYNSSEYYKVNEPNQFTVYKRMNHYHEEKKTALPFRNDILNDSDDLYDSEIVLFIEENTTNAVRTFEVPLRIGPLSKTLTIIQKASEN